MAAPCQACVKDGSFCIYCQKQYASPGRLHRHIQTQHIGTIRAHECTKCQEVHPIYNLKCVRMVGHHPPCTQVVYWNEED